MVEPEKEELARGPEDGLLTLLAQALYDKKGFNILILDVRGISSITDYFVIAEGTSNRHVKGLADHLSDVLKNQGMELLRQEGQQASDWIVLDYGDLIVHLFIPDQRNHYRLEEVWREAGIVNVTIDTEERS